MEKAGEGEGEGNNNIGQGELGGGVGFEGTAIQDGARVFCRKIQHKNTLNLIILLILIILITLQI